MNKTEVESDSAQNTARSYRANQLSPLADLAALVGLDKCFNGDVLMHGADPLLRSPHRLSEATAYALLLEGMAASSVWQHANKQSESSSMEVYVADAIHALHSTHFLWHSGYSMSVGAEFIPTNGIFRCRDGKYIMTESGPPYVKLERGYLNFFNCGNNREAIAKAISNYDALDLQEQLSALGLPASIAHSPEEWRNHPQGEILAQCPVIEIEKIADGDPVEFLSGSKYPLDSVRVIDFTHVLAGPRSMRSLAQYGAEVLHISSPYHRDSVAQNLLVNIGKRSAYLLLTQVEDRKKIHELIDGADVFSFSYRPSVAEKFGLTPAELAQKHRGIVCLTVNAYGHSGSWKLRPGFDHNVQVATGIAHSEGAARHHETVGETGAHGHQNGGIVVPQLSPVFYLNDFLTGYLAAAGVMAALLRRATEGGSYHVKVSLARSAMWVQDLGYLAESQYKSAPESDNYPVNLHTIQTACGKVTELEPAVSFSSLPRKNLETLQPFGADPPEFL